MIHEFSFGNFLSFKDINSLNMTSAKINDLDNKGVIENKVPLLKSKAIYGANASGKSNIIKALVAFLRIVNGTIKSKEVINRLVNNFKLSIETDNEPTFFQLIFEVENITYRYGFEATNNKIVSEWLYGRPKEKMLAFFIREGNKIIEIDKTNFGEGYKRLSMLGDGDDTIFDETSLFLTTIAFLNGKKSQKILNYFGDIMIVSGLKDNSLQLHNYAKDFLKKDINNHKILDLLKLADIGIKNIGLTEYSEEYFPKEIPKEVIDNFKGETVLVSEHNKYNSNNKIVEKEYFDFLYSESEGTKKIFELSPIIINTLSKGTPIIIDEFDARFHPLISKKIVELFNSNDNKNAQLIFVTHDTNLLSNKLLRRDQIDFVEKDKYGASHLYSLVQFKGIRKNAQFEKDYIQGKYGAIPFLGDFSQILKSDEDA